VRSTTHEIQVVGDAVVKTFLRGANDEADREWSALLALQRCDAGLAPEPLARSMRDGRPEIRMSRLRGSPLVECTEIPLNAVAVGLRRLHAALPSGELLRFVPRRWPGAELYQVVADRVHAEIPAAIPSVSRDAFRAAGAWLDTSEAAATAGAPIDAVFGQGDGNAANLLWDGESVRFVDFEDSGLSDAAYEVADLVEHPTMQLTPEQSVLLVDALNYPSATRQRISSYRRLFAIYWLTMLLPGQPAARRNAPDALARQSSRTLAALHES